MNKLISESVENFILKKFRAFQFFSFFQKSSYKTPMSPRIKPEIVSISRLAEYALIRNI